MHTRWSPELTRLLNPSSGTRSVKIKDLEYHVFPCNYQNSLLNIAENIDKLIVSGDIQKHENNSTASLFSIDNVTFFGKHVRFNQKSFDRRLRYLIQPSRSFWTAVVAQKMTQAGIPTPRVFAVGERRAFHLISDSYIVTEALTNAQMLHTVVSHHPNNIEFLEKSARLLRHLHDAGITHGDAKLANFYVQDKTWGLWDLDSAQIFAQTVPLKWIVKDIGRLLSSFIVTVDEQPNSKTEFMNTKKIAEALANAYGIDTHKFLPFYYSYWLKKIKLTHDFG